MFFNMSLFAKYAKKFYLFAIKFNFRKKKKYFLSSPIYVQTQKDCNFSILFMSNVTFFCGFMHLLVNERENVLRLYCEGHNDDKYIHE